MTDRGLLYYLPLPPSNKIGWPWTIESDLLPSTMPNGGVWPKISIVTPSYNQGQFLEETIRSVLLQNYPNLEYIIIDGGSTDNSVEIIKKYEPWITYWVSERDHGQSDAINKGLEMCTGKNFNWLNSDDYLEKGSLAAVAQCFKSDLVNVVCGSTNLLYLNGEISKVSTPFDNDVEKMIFNAEIIQPSTFYRTTIIKELGGLNRKLNFCMDQELWIKYLLFYANLGIQKINVSLANFRYHENSKTVDKTQSFFEESKIIGRGILNLFHAPRIVFKQLLNVQGLNIDLDKNLSTINEKINREKLLSMYLTRCYGEALKKKQIMRIALYLLYGLILNPQKPISYYSRNAALLIRSWTHRDGE